MGQKKIIVEEVQQLGFRLQQIREQAKLTKSDIAREHGVTNSTVGRWEDGRVEPPLGYLIWIVEKFQVDANWLLCGRQSSLEIEKQELEDLRAANHRLAGELMESQKKQLRLHERLDEALGAKKEVSAPVFTDVNGVLTR